MRAPIAVKRSGCLRNVTTSCSSSLLRRCQQRHQFDPGFGFHWKRARDLPNLRLDLDRRNVTRATKRKNSPPINRIGKLDCQSPQIAPLRIGWASKLTFAFLRNQLRSVIRQIHPQPLYTIVEFRIDGFHNCCPTTFVEIHAGAH